AADVAEHLPDLLLAVGNSPFRGVDLRVVGEQIQDAAPVPGFSCPVEGFQIVDDDRLPLLVGHRLLCYRHPSLPENTASSRPQILGRYLASFLRSLCAAAAARYESARIGPIVAPPAQ